MGTEFTLDQGRSVQVAGSRLAIHFTEVLADSRCAVNARCFWEGNAEVILIVSRRLEPGDDADAPVLAAKLVLNTSERYERARKVGNLTIGLHRLDPSNFADRPVKRYSVTLSVQEAA
jgi:hypothetical protein